MTKADLQKKPSEVAAMFDEVAETYDRTNDLLSFGQDRAWRKKVLAAVDPSSGQAILDLAAGTGSSSVVFCKPGVRVVAGDFSQGMLAVGRKRHPEIEFVFADATALPFEKNEFDAVTISFGLRNVVDTGKALREMLRVTKPGGRLVICEFSEVSNPLLRGLYNFYLRNVLPIFSRLAAKNMPAYSYLSESIQAWPKQEALAALISDAGWERVSYKNLTFGVVALHIAFKAQSAAPGSKAAK
ncbi:MAG: demethylmenaquinone methyltransferase [Actinomycetales bacterium]|nr:demethylmenaquinone methyltransferase [Actinomycetales bacterium]